jgi:hypothetical protein
MPLAVALWMSLLVLLIIFSLFFQQGRASRVRRWRDPDPAAAPRLLPFFFSLFRQRVSQAHGTPPTVARYCFSVGWYKTGFAIIFSRALSCWLLACSVVLLAAAPVEELLGGNPHVRNHDRLLSGWIQPQTNAVEHDSTRLLRENKLSRTTRVATATSYSYTLDWWMHGWWCIHHHLVANLKCQVHHLSRIRASKVMKTK